MCVTSKRICHFSLAAIASLACWGAAISSVQASPEIEIVDRSRGCFHHKEKVVTFDRKGDSYISSDGRTLTVKQLNELFTVIDESANSRTIDLETLGVTPEAVAMHQKDMLAASLADTKNVPSTVLERNSNLFDFSAVRDVLKLRLVWKDYGTTHDCVNVTINDSSLGHGRDRIRLSSSHRCPWMLPWSVTMGERRWQTYSTALPLALSRLADKAGPCAQWLDGRQYWQKDVWNDCDFWWSAVGSKLRAERDLLVAKQLSGYDEAAKIFGIDRCTIADYPVDKSSLSIYLRVLQPDVISKVHWLTILNDGKIGEKTQTWLEMISVYKRCVNVVNAHKWLSLWRLDGIERSVSANIVGNLGFSGTPQHLNKNVLPTWRAAKMKGAPEIELTLFRKHVYCGTVYLSSADNRALVYSIEPNQGAHWLDRQNVSWEHPGYLVVQTDGTFEKHALKPFSYKAGKSHAKD